MAIKRIASQDNGNGSNLNPQVLSWPATPAQGDLLIAVLFNSTNAAFTLPTGWSSAVDSTYNGNTRRVGIAYAIAGASEPSSLSFGFSTGTGQALMYEYRGNSTFNVLDKAPAIVTGTANTATAPLSGTTAYADELVIFALGTAGVNTGHNWTAATDLLATGRIAPGELIVTSISSYQDTINWTTSTSFGVLTATFTARTPISTKSLGSINGGANLRPAPFKPGLAR